MKTQTEPDPIIEELHAIRREIAARFDNHIHRIGLAINESGDLATWKRWEG